MKVKFLFINLILVVLLYSEDSVTPSSFLGEVKKTITTTITTTTTTTSTPILVTPNSIKYILNINTIPKNSRYILKNSKNKTINYTWGMKLTQGKYSLKVFKKGYKSKNISINLNQNKSIPIKLEQICKLKINTNISNPIIRFRNSKRNYSKGMILTCNQSYFLNISKAGYITEHISTLMRNSDTTIPVTLKPKIVKPRYCKLTILPNKKGARVYITNINKKYKNGIKLICGKEYHIKVTKRGCTTRRFSTTVTPNERIPVNLKCR